MMKVFLAGVTATATMAGGAQAANLFVQGEALKCRFGPGKGYEVVKSLPRAHKVEEVTRYNGWVQVRASGSVCWSAESRLSGTKPGAAGSAGWAKKRSAPRDPWPDPLSITFKHTGQSVPPNGYPHPADVVRATSYATTGGGSVRKVMVQRTPANYNSGMNSLNGYHYLPTPQPGVEQWVEIPGW